jgi:hypothetical protein
MRERSSTPGNERPEAVRPAVRRPSTARATSGREHGEAFQRYRSSSPSCSWLQSAWQQGRVTVVRYAARLLGASEPLVKPSTMNRPAGCPPSPRQLNRSGNPSRCRRGGRRRVPSLRRARTPAAPVARSSTAGPRPRDDLARIVDLLRAPRSTTAGLRRPSASRLVASRWSCGRRERPSPESLHAVRTCSRLSRINGVPVAERRDRPSVVGGPSTPRARLEGPGSRGTSSGSDVGVRSTSQHRCGTRPRRPGRPRSRGGSSRPPGPIG